MPFYPILDARESRDAVIKSWLALNKPVILIKANTPGTDKNLWFSKVLVNYFSQLIKKTCEIDDVKHYQSLDGPYALLRLDMDGIESIKRVLIHIEESHPIGRYIDLDLYESGRMRSISRVDLDLPMRPCMLCQGDALACIRLKRHDSHQLIRRIEEDVMSFLTSEMRHAIDVAMERELALEDKFGLVTKSSRGSHPDMDYDLMVRAKDAILDGFIDIFQLGLHASTREGLFDQARKIGQTMETDMLKETNGINCYKGLIFALGFVVLSTGYTIGQNGHRRDIGTHIAMFAKDIFTDFDYGLDTFGIKAFHAHGITGIRGEAKSGFLSIKKILDAYPNLHKQDDRCIRKALRDLILTTDDTVFLKRSGSMERYLEIKESLLNLNLDLEGEAARFTKGMIKERVSFGGAADLLVTALFLSQVAYLIE